MDKIKQIQVIKDISRLTSQASTDIVKLFFGSLTETMIKGDRGWRISI